MAVQIAQGSEIHPQTLFLSAASLNIQIKTYMYIHRHPGSPLAPSKPANTAAMRNPEKRGPTEVKT